MNQLPIIVLRCACGDTPADEVPTGRDLCVDCGMPLRPVERPPIRKPLEDPK